MTIRQEMTAAAKQAKGQLAESAELVAAFIKSKANSDGGFAGRAADSDLYYTVFAIESLNALDENLDGVPMQAYLESFKTGDRLDLVHLGSLARCIAACRQSTGEGPGGETVTKIAANIEKSRCADGSYSITQGAEHGDVYGCFIATAAMEDLGAGPVDPQAIVDRLRELRQPDGGYANEQTTRAGSTPATAAAVTLLQHLTGRTDEQACRWLLERRHSDGGFVAMPALAQLGTSDLLSTATALHALSVSAVPLDDIRESCLDFLDSLWSSEGAFAGSKADPTLDCEYTYYGLLALGHLTT